MSDRHVSDEDLGALAALRVDDPRRRHVDSCAKCRARWLDYQSFMEGETLPAEAGAEAARDALLGTIRREFATGPAARPRRVAFPGPSSSWAGAALAAAAAVLIVAAAGWWIAGRSPTSVLRGPSRSLDAPLALMPAEWQGDSVVVFRWRGHPRGERYEVRLYGSDLVERGRFDAGRDSALRARTEEIPREPGGLAWRVIALRGGVEVGQSEFRTIPGR